MMGSSLDIVWQLLSALGVGLLIGIERGWYGRKEDEGDRVAGIRTFSLVGLLGGILAAMSPVTGEWLLPAALVGFIALVIVSYYFEIRLEEQKDFGITTEISLILTFVLGIWAALGYQLEALASAVAVMAILSLKQVLHGWLQRMEAATVYAGIKLLVISVVLLPILPNQGYGPWESLNPYWIWWMVVLISAISFMGYLLMMYTGKDKGILLTSLVGGLISSTAVSISLGQRSKQHRMVSGLFKAGVLIASSVMLIRVLIEVSVVNPGLITSLYVPVAGMLLVTLMGVAWLWIRSGKQESSFEEELNLGNPLQLSMSIKFGLFLAMIMVLASALQDWFGDQGIYLLSMISGLMDVDAVTISLSRMSHLNLSFSTASVGIIIAVISNTLFKAALFLMIAGIRKNSDLLWLTMLIGGTGFILSLIAT